jgi:8-oxo-dGTP diphosphatase
MERKLIPVTAAVIIYNGKILIARRKKEQHMGLKWEFPGGKIKKNETPEACLIRELAEEFSIKAQIREFFFRSTHHYQTKSIELISYIVDYKSGEFIPHDHEEIRWITREELGRFDFADADMPIVKKLSTLRII